MIRADDHAWIAARDVAALADQLLVDAIEIRDALTRANLADQPAIVDAFVTPRAKAGRLLHQAAHLLRQIPDLGGTRESEAHLTFAETENDL